jgi:geranylgeranyl pyrophosphate synthase
MLRPSFTTCDRNLDTRFSGDEMFPAIDLCNGSHQEQVYAAVPERLWERGLNDPVRRFLSRSGKGIRPELVNELFRLSGGSGEAPSAISEAIELLHAGSLIIDDIEDDSAERRGRPTLHREIGVPLALNTGNWMYFQAIDRLANSPFRPRTRHRILARTTRVVRRCHEGQALDLSARVDLLAPNEIPPTARAISRLKTGGITALAAWLGATAAGAPPEIRQALSRFGMTVGMCLQMYNDLLELGRFAKGDERSDDLRNLRVTWPWAWAVKEFPEGKLLNIQKRLGRLTEDHHELRELAVELFAAVDARGQERIESCLAQGLAQLGEHIVLSRSLLALLDKLRR